MREPRPDPFEREASKPIAMADAHRLVRFERWVSKLLCESLQWPADARRRDKQIHQCRAFIIGAVADMGRRGYLFRDAELARMIRESVADISARQKRGEITELYPYLRVTWSGYVGGRAEELRERAIGLGQHIDKLVGRARALSIAELADRDRRDRRERNAAKSLRAAKQAARKAACSEVATPLLPGLDAPDF